jgi:DNA-directed RNA polymerase subunit RPC12/RpoP
VDLVPRVTYCKGKGANTCAYQESRDHPRRVGGADEPCGEDGANSERVITSERSEVRYPPGATHEGQRSYYHLMQAITMAVMYYMCADCGNAVQEIKVSRLWDRENRVGEYCDDCNNWNPEVVIAYR